MTTTERPNSSTGFDVFKFDRAPRGRHPLSFVLRDRASGDLYVHASLLGSPVQVLAITSFDGEPMARRDGESYVRASFLRQCRPSLADVCDEIERQVAEAIADEVKP